MAFRCSSCGGSLVFDPASQQMKCLHCGSFSAPENFQLHDTSTEEMETEGLTSFLCQNCGAQLSSTEDSMIGFCPYCGGQSMLSKPASGARVEQMIPFQVSKESCAQLYGSFAGKVPYLPRELKDAAFLQNFTGIYMPFYEYDVAFGQARIIGTKTVERNPRYDVINTYQIQAAAEGAYRGTPFDGSRYLDDAVAEKVQPFDLGKERPFNPAYLSGFYADTATVEPQVYDIAAGQKASDDVVGEVASRMFKIEGIAVDQASSSIDTSIQQHHTVLFPLWFLTWRKDDRVAYAVVNGESGKVVSDLPVDLKRFWMGCGVISLVLFLILELLFQPTPLITSMLSLGAALLMSFFVAGSTKTLYNKETHAQDAGWKSTEEPGVSAAPVKAKKSGFPLIGLVIILVLAAMFFTDGGFSSLLGDASLSSMIAVIGLIPVVINFFRVMRWQKFVPGKDTVASIAVILLSAILNVAVVVLSPVNDGWYYIGDAICILGLLLAAIWMLLAYNRSTTRPLPKLFDRTEVDR